MDGKDYKTVLTAAEAEQTINKSRFIGVVFHAETEDDVAAEIAKEVGLHKPNIIKKAFQSDSRLLGLRAGHQPAAGKGQ